MTKRQNGLRLLLLYYFRICPKVSERFLLLRNLTKEMENLMQMWDITVSTSQASPYQLKICQKSVLDFHYILFFNMTSTWNLATSGYAVEIAWSIKNDSRLRRGAVLLVS